jgi:hypothetical protein
MSSAFIYAGSPAFGKVKESQTSGDYITNKKTKYTFCNPNLCHPNKNVNTESNLLMLKRANALAFYPCLETFDSTQLYINLYTKLNLTGVTSFTDASGVTAPVTLSKYPPTLINVSNIPFTNYFADPSGSLFGNTVCGENNWQNYIVYNNNTTTPSTST